VLHFRPYPNASYYEEGETVVSAVTVDGEAATRELLADPTVLAVNLGQAVLPGDGATIRLAFRTIVPEASFGILGGRAGRGWWFADWYPILAGWEPDDGPYLDPPTPFGDPTFAEAATYELTFTAPDHYRVLGSGVTRHRTVDGLTGQATTTIEAGLGRDLALSLLPVGPGIVSAGEREELRFVLTHELGHQWIGGIIGSNNNDHGFISEGLTNTLAVLVIREVDGPAVAEGYLREWVASGYRVMVETSGDGVVDAPIRATTDIVSRARLVYGKAALGFEAIRQEIGDAAFFAGLDAYAREYRFAVSAPEDLRRAFDAASGADIAPLWSFWFEERATTVADIDALLDGFATTRPSPPEACQRYSRSFHLAMYGCGSAASLVSARSTFPRHAERSASVSEAESRHLSRVLNDLGRHEKRSLDFARDDVGRIDTMRGPSGMHITMRTSQPSLCLDCHHILDTYRLDLYHSPCKLIWSHRVTDPQ